MNSHSWRDDAACINSDPELFFPSEWRKGAAAEALSICYHCPVIQACYTWAMESKADGILGGTTEGERRAIRRRRPTDQKQAASLTARRPDLPTFRIVP